jgi:hypothetical protein
MKKFLFRLVIVIAAFPLIMTLGGIVLYGIIGLFAYLYNLYQWNFYEDDLEKILLLTACVCTAAVIWVLSLVIGICRHVDRWMHQGTGKSIMNIIVWILFIIFAFAIISCVRQLTDF